MDTLSEQQQDEIYKHLNSHDGESFETHASWVKQNYGIAVSAQELKTWYIERLF